MWHTTAEVQMNRPGALRTLFLSLILVPFGCSTEFAFAGVHGGGGFHGGGGGGYHGGGGYGGWHGGGYGGWHGGGYGGWHGGYGGWQGGYGGWHGGYGGGYGWRGGYYGGWGSGWGWGWGWPWGFGISFNFGWPSWGYYGYPYAYPYPYYYPYSYYAPGSYAPSSAPPDYPGATAPPQAGGNYQNGGPVRQPAPPTNTLTLRETVSRHAAVNYGTTSAATGTVSYRPASAERQLPPMRPEVQNVIRALRAMPPE